MEPKAEALKLWVDKNYSGCAVVCAYEAGCCGFEPARMFKSFGWYTIVFNPADIHRTGTTTFHKTDKIDAKLICRELQDNRLKSICVPSVKREELRALFRRRLALVRDLRRIKSQIKMQLLYLGIQIPQNLDTPKWSHAFRNWLKEIRCYYVTGNQMIESQCRHYEFIESEVRDVSNKLRAYCRANYKNQYYLLKSVPGIGGIVACGILSELGDLNRLKSNKQLAAYVGFMPYIKQSGETSFSMGISPRANHHIRSYFVEAAWEAIRKDPALKEYYKMHTGKNSKAIIIKVAHKLLNRVRSVIKNNTPYELGVIK